jgi:LPS-assembly protein
MAGSNVGRALTAVAVQLALAAALGTALGAAVASSANAQDKHSGGVTAKTKKSSSTKTAAPAPGSPEDMVYLEADEVFTDPDTGRYVGRGNVVVRYGTRTIRADEVTVFPEDNRVLATGNIVIEDDSGIVTYAKQAEVTEDLKNGVITGMAARMPSKSGAAKTGAAVAIRRDASTNELRRAFYTICEPCAKKGKTGAPTWRLKARKVTQDTKAEMLYYRDAVLEVKGVPVLYAPFFAHADPSSERRSGFLMPYFGESSRMGFFFEQPYYWAITSSQDLTLSPRIMSDVNPMLLFEYREKFFSGGVVVQGSVTHEQEFANDGVKYGDDEWRGHIFASGAFDITQHWRWGFGVERVSDDLYFRRYDIDDSDKDRGLYSRGSLRLLSQLFLEGHGRDFYASIATLAFQGLRAVACPTAPDPNNPSAPFSPNGQCDEDDSAFPYVAPIGEYDQRVTHDTPLLGGRLDSRVTTAVLERNQGLPDSRRASFELDWQRQLIAPAGIVVTPFAHGREDVYSVSDFIPGTTIVPGTSTLTGTPTGPTVNDVFGRTLGYVGSEVSWPWGRTAGNVDLVLEPMGQIILSPLVRQDPRIPNNDSQVTVLDESNLFEANRVPGYDLWEDGSRAVLGARAIARWAKQSEASFFLGQSYRSKDAIQFASTTGLAGDVSDVVGSAEFAFDPTRRVAARFALDDKGFDIRRLDVDAAYKLGRANFTAKYLRLAADDQQDLATQMPQEELSFSTGLEITHHWGAYYAATRDLILDEDRYAFIGLVYNDECSRFEVIYKHDGTRDRALSQGESVRVQFTLTSLGSFGG